MNESEVRVAAERHRELIATSARRAALAPLWEVTVGGALAAALIGGLTVLVAAGQPLALIVIAAGTGAYFARRYDTRGRTRPTRAPAATPPPRLATGARRRGNWLQTSSEPPSTANVWPVT